MDNPKALQTFIDLEVARCNERWVDIPELARRYKKYHPYESVLEFTARMEAEFILLVRQIRQEMMSTEKKQVADDPQPSPTTSAPSTRKWGNRQVVNTIGSSTNLTNSSTAVGTTSIVKRNYPEESDIFYELDDPSNISLTPRLQPSQVQLILVRLLDVIQRQIKTGELETPDDWQAQFSKIILARIYYETGRYDKALEWLQHLALRLEDVEEGYGLVLLVQARVIKGICFENQENYADALDSYLGALKVAEQHPEEQNKSLSFWLEECLYRSVLLQLRKKGPVKQTLKLMRTYLHYCCTQWPSDWRIHKRWILFRHYIRYLTRAYQKGVYVPSSPEDEYTSPASPILSPTRSVFSETGDTTLFERSAAALDETIQLMTQFRGLLTVFANQTHKKNPVDLNHRAIELTYLMFTAHDTVGWGPTEYVRRTLRYLYRIRKFTFNSLCTTRYLCYTLLRLGQVLEAKRALAHYLELLSVPHILEKETEEESFVQQLDHENGSEEEDEDGTYLENVAESIQNRLDYISRESLTSCNDNLLQWERKLSLLQEKEQAELDTIYSSDDDYDDSNGPRKPMPKKKAPTGSYESDMEFDVVKLLLTITQQLYGQHEQRGQEAAALSDVAVTLLEESEYLKKRKASQWRALMVQGRRIRGTSYGLYAAQCHDEKRRSTYLAEALMSLKRASELDSRSWQTFYELGLQQAIMGDMVSSAASVKRSIKLRGDFIPSWHLLSLIQSSRQFHALPKSLQLIQAALGYHMNMIENFDNEEDPELVFDLDTEEGIEFFNRAEAFMRIRMSQVYILEVMEGSEAVLKIYPDLFDMYAKLSKRMNLPILGAPGRAASQRKLSSASNSRQESIKSQFIKSNISSVDSILDDDDDQSLDSSNFALPPTTMEEDDTTAGDDYFNNSQLQVYANTTKASTPLDLEEAILEENSPSIDKKSSSGRRKQRKSISLPRQVMDDPLLSFPGIAKSKREKKEKRESKGNRKSSILGSKSLFRSNSPAKTDSSSNLIPTTTTEDTKLSGQEDHFRSSEATFSGTISSSSGSVKTSATSRPNQQHSSSYFSSLSHLSQIQQESSTTLPKQDKTTTTAVSSPKSSYYIQRQERWKQILIQLWVMTSATYTRSRRLDEAYKAISEADLLTHSHSADVWNQIGKIADVQSKELGPYQDRALDAFKRALSINPDHIASHISLASKYICMKQFELAEQLLEKIVKGLGHNQAEAWYLLGQVYRTQENHEDAKNSFMYALKLSDTSTVCELDGLPRFV